MSKDVFEKYLNAKIWYFIWTLISEYLLQHWLNTSMLHYIKTSAKLHFTYAVFESLSTYYVNQTASFKMLHTTQYWTVTCFNSTILNVF